MTTFNLELLVTSDIHGNVFPLNYGTNAHTELGFAKIATLIKQQQSNNEHTITIDNGDVIQGTPLTYHYAKYQHSLPNPMIKLLNQLHYDAGVVGNHEFNYGQDVLIKAVNEANYPWLSANIINTETNEPYFGKPYIIKSLADGLQVGILGLTTKYIPNWEKEDHIEGMQFDDPVQTAEKWVKVLKEEEKVDVVVVAYHGGFERDLDTGEPSEVLTGENQGYQICMEVDGIDVLLTGHQHRQISGKEINGVTVVQPGNNGLVLGKVSIEMDKNGEKYSIINKNSELLSVEGVSPDESVLEAVQNYEDATQEWLDQPIGHIEGDMLVRDSMAVRLKDTPLIEFMNRVQMDAADVDVACTALFDNNAPGFPANVTMRSVVSNYIYPNTLVVIKASGAVIKEALERSARYFVIREDGEIDVCKEFTTPKPQHYNYDMWEGIEYELDIRKPKGERVTRLEYKGSAIQPDQKIEVVMNNYRAGGGGDYTMYKDCPVVKEIPIDVSELIADYILEHKVIKPTVNHNWKVIY